MSDRPAPRTREAFDAVAASLAGLRLRGVRYFEGSYAPRGHRRPGFPGHQSALGCDLEFDGGRIHGVGWDSEFFAYGVGVFEASMRTRLRAPIEVDVTGEAPWAALVGRAVERVEVHWNRVLHAGRTRSFPQDLELAFAGGGTVYLTACEYVTGEDRLRPCADDLAILFSEADAERYAVGRHAPAAFRAAP